MLRLATLSPLLFIATAASAKTIDLTWFSKGVEVELQGEVTLDLIRSPGDGLPTVAWESMDAEWEPKRSGLALVDLSGLPSGIPDDVAKAIGASVEEVKAKFLGGKTLKVATIPELHVGNAVFRNLRAVVGDQTIDGVPASADGIRLGLAAIPGIAAAIRTTKGTVEIVPTANAGKLLDSVGPASERSSTPVGKYYVHGKVMHGAGVPVLLAGKVGGAEGSLVLATTRSDTRVTGAVELDSFVRRGGIARGPARLVVGGVDLHTPIVISDQSIVSSAENLLAVVGYDVLYDYDVAVDPRSSRVAVANAKGVKWSSPRDGALDYALKDFEYAEKKASEAEKKDKDEPRAGEDPGDADAVSRNTAYADRLWRWGETAKALEHYKAAADAAGDTCAAHHAYGRKLIEVGKTRDAVTPLTRAAELWDKWYSQPLDVRTAIGDKVIRLIPEGAYQLKQDTSCYTAWGDVARAQLALGDHKAVGAVFAAHLDLDPTVPFIEGVSLIGQGKAAEANGMLRRAINLGNRNDPETRVALAVVYGRLGDAEMVARQADALAKLDELPDLDVMLPLVQAAMRSGGDDTVARVVDAFVSADPTGAAAHLTAAFAAQVGGDAAAAEKLVRESDALVEAEHRRTAGSHAALCHRAMHALLAGDTTAARRSLDEALVVSAPTSLWYQVSVLVANAAGDPVAAEHFKLLARTNPGNIASTITIVD